MRKLRIIHTADLHLDSPYEALGIEKAIGNWIAAMNMPLIVLALILPLFNPGKYR